MREASGWGGIRTRGWKYLSVPNKSIKKGYVCFYLRPAQIYKSYNPSVQSSSRPVVRSGCQSQPFDPLIIFLFSRNSVSICTSKKVTSGHMSQGRSPKVKVTGGDKLVKFHNFFTFSRTPPTFLIRQGWKRIGMCRMTIRKNWMQRNFEFLPSRSDIQGQRSNL